ncbi:hypothetical protein [Salinisphaera sp. Q1T1-3]|uniref:hypothetical protein n=1 Tax=Salinisphaera sp. Q1T1-3 TaxID=2321229 RepID=UPI000E75F14B|nr:hypothetical protein [Salinisphaera sp. Q1T1-3]RJS92895.1 hypothetical protein D3260_10105 [Salinisphaera sp. Q1T1-3]
MPDDGTASVLMTMTRDQLHATAIRYFKTAGPTEPEVALVERDGHRVVFKDYGRGQGWFARLVAPVLIWREASALEALASLPGVPRLIRRVDARGVLIEYCPAVPWGQARPADAAYARLSALVAEIHARGIAHGDLRGGGNFLVDDSGQPYVVDFVARVRRGRTWNIGWNWLFAQFVGADDSALAKLRVKHAPHLATAADRARLARRGPLERLARTIGETVRRLTRQFASRD